MTTPTGAQVVITPAGGGAAQVVVTPGGLPGPAGPGVDVLTTLGDLLYENSVPTAARLAGNTTAVRQFLTQTGTGTVSAAPAWGTIAAADVPTLNQNTTGTASNITDTLDQVPAPVANVSMNGHALTAASDLAVSGLSGATAASRYAGATASGHPVTGTFATGDFVIDQAGAVWVCTSAGSPGTWVSTAALTAEPPFTAADAGYLAWNSDPDLGAQCLLAPVAGMVTLARINVRQAISCTNVVLSVPYAGSGLTSSECFAGLYGSSGTLIGTSADQSSSWATAGIYPAALSGGPYVLAAGFYWAAILVNGTTSPSFLAASGFPTATTGNNGFTVSTARGATATTGRTTLPASFTPSANSFCVAAWAALS